MRTEVIGAPRARLGEPSTRVDRGAFPVAGVSVPAALGPRYSSAPSSANGSGPLPVSAVDGSSTGGLPSWSRCFHAPSAVYAASIAGEAEVSRRSRPERLTNPGLPDSPAGS